MNSEEIKLQKQLEELEKRISKTSTSGVTVEQIKTIVDNNTSDIKEDITDLQEDIEVTQTQINKLTDNVQDVSNQVQTLSLEVEENAVEVETITQQVQTLSVDLEETSNQVQTLSLEVEEASSEVQTLSDQVQQAQTIISNTQEELSTLQTTTTQQLSNFGAVISSLAPVAFTGNYNDLVNIPTKLDFPTNTGTTSDFEYFSSSVNRKIKEGETFGFLNFVCEPGELVYGQIKFVTTCNASGAYPGGVYMKVNNKLVAEAVTYFAIDSLHQKQLIINFCYMPDSAINYVTFTSDLTMTGTLQFYDIDMIIHGKNIMVLNDLSKNQVVAFDNNLYLCTCSMHYGNDNFCYRQSTTDFVNPDDMVFTKYATSVYSSKPTYQYFPASSAISVISSEMTGRNVVRTFVDDTMTSYIFSNAYYLSACSVSYTKNDTINDSSAYPYINLYLLNEDQVDAPKYGKVRTEPRNLCFQSQPLPSDTFCDIQAVLPTYTEDLDETQFYGYIMVRKDGTCFYFPDLDSSYYINLGIGRRPMGYYRKGTITIILGGNKFCTRLILQKNSSGFWVLANKYVYHGIDNFRLINNDKYVYAYVGTHGYFDLKQKYFPDIEDIDSVTYNTATEQET